MAPCPGGRERVLARAWLRAAVWRRQQGMPGAEAGSILTPNAGDEQLPGGAEPPAPKPGETEAPALLCCSLL